MFESGTSLGDEDLELETSFTPVFSSTQNQPHEKRKNDLPADENTKKSRMDNNPSIKCFNKNPNNFENLKEHCFSPKQVVKRMFPGPAGLIPDDIEKDSEFTSHKSGEYIEDFLFCSQRTESTFVEGPWKLMKDDFTRSGQQTQLYETYTINWIKKKYCQKKHLDNHKAPFLAAVIQSLEIEDGKMPSVHVTLKDTTGVIDAVVLYSFYKANLKYLTTGSVLVLKQISVLSIHEAQCLTLTSNNVLVIYHVRDPNTKEDVEKDDPIETIKLQEYSIEDIWKEANTVKVTKSSSDVLTNLNNKPQFSNNHKANYRPGISNGPKYTNYNKNNFTLSHKHSSSNSNKFLLPNVSTIGVNTMNRPSSSSSSDFMNALPNGTSESKPKKFEFKKVNNRNSVEADENVVISCSQMSVQANKNDSEIWKTVLEDIDTESLFGDF